MTATAATAESPGADSRMARGRAAAARQARPRPARARLSVQRERAPRPGAQLRRPVHHAFGRGRQDPRRPAARLDHRRQRTAARRHRGHRRSRLADVEAEFGKEIAAIVDGLTKIAKLPTRRLDAGAAGRELPQAPALDRQGRARHHRQARRPPAQHADARLAAAREAPPHRAGDARPLRAARPPLRYGEAPVGARGSRVQTSRTRGV